VPPHRGCVQPGDLTLHHPHLQGILSADRQNNPYPRHNPMVALAKLLEQGGATSGQGRRQGKAGGRVAIGLSFNKPIATRGRAEGREAPSK
jgi:hypothetical protein